MYPIPSYGDFRVCYITVKTCLAKANDINIIIMQDDFKFRFMFSKGNYIQESNFETISLPWMKTTSVDYIVPRADTPLAIFDKLTQITGEFTYPTVIKV